MPSAVHLTGQAIGDAGQNAIAARVAPQHQVAGGDVGVGDRPYPRGPAPRRGTGGAIRRWRASVRTATHGATPGASGVPVGVTKTKLSMKASSMGPCSPWTLCRPLAGGVIGEAPLRAGFAEARQPGTVAAGHGRGQLLAVDGDGGLARKIQRTAARAHFQREGGDVGRGDVHRRIAGDFGIEAGAFPVLAERVDGQPLHAIVGQRPGGEFDFARVRVAAALGDLVEDAVDLHLGIGMVAVRRLRADDAHQAHAFGGQGALHHVAGLLLRIDLAVVFHGGNVI